MRLKRPEVNITVTDILAPAIKLIFIQLDGGGGTFPNNSTIPKVSHLNTNPY